MDGNHNELFRLFLPNLCLSKLRKSKIFRLLLIVVFTWIIRDCSTVFGNDVAFLPNNYNFTANKIVAKLYVSITSLVTIALSDETRIWKIY